MHLELRNLSDPSGVPTIAVSGGVDHQNAANLYEAVRKAARRPPHRVKLDLSPLEAIDSAGIATLVTLRREIEARGGSLEIVEMNEQSARMAAMLPWRREAPPPPPASPSFLERIGEGSISLATALLEV
ncbi:MAG: anti-sigma factor antagonist, partial [Deltaproteobacteria bacterium]